MRDPLHKSGHGSLGDLRAPAMALLLLAGCAPNEEPQKAPELSPRLSQELSLYRNGLAELVHRGYEVEMTHPIACRHAPKEFEEVLEAALPEKMKLNSVSYLAPFTHFYERHKAHLDRPRELAENARKKRNGQPLSSKVMNVIWIDINDEGRVQCLSALSPQQPVLFERQMNLKNKDSVKRVAAALAEILQDHLSPYTNSPETLHRELLRSLPRTPEWNSLFTLDHNQHIPEREQKTLEALFQDRDFKGLSLEVLPNGNSVGGRYSGSHLTAFPPLAEFLKRPRHLLYLDREDFKKIQELGYPSVHAHGDVERVEFYQKFPKNELIEHLGLRGGHLPRSLRDGFENLVSASRTVQTFPPTLTLSISQPPEFARIEAMDVKNLSYPLALGISTLFLDEKIGDLEHTFFGSPYIPVYGTDKKAVYTQIERKWAQENLKEAFPLLVQGVTHFEDLVGRNDIRSVLITGTDIKNAGMGGDSPIPVHVNVKACENTKGLETVMFHETFHYYDAVLKLTDGAFKESFKAMRQTDAGWKFLADLKESKYLPLAWSGHGHSNEKEAGASLATILFRHKDLDTFQKDLPADYRPLFQELGTALLHQAREAATTGKIDSRCEFILQLEALFGG
jgi:hypothetical protein